MAITLESFLASQSDEETIAREAAAHLADIEAAKQQALDNDREYAEWANSWLDEDPRRIVGRIFRGEIAGRG